MTDGAPQPRPQGGPASAHGLAARLHASFGCDVTMVGADLGTDDRGCLTAFDLDRLGFTVRRVFAVTGVPAGALRGGHRHHRGVQALFCLNGRIEVELRRGREHVDVALLPDGAGLLIAAGVWSRQRYALHGSELLVLASEPYDPSSYDPNPLTDP